jgi:hypothetical protein
LGNNAAPVIGKNLGSNIFKSNRAPCQICGKANHQALDCYHRMNYSYQGRHPPSQLAAMAAYNQSTQDEEPWFADSGANNHITAELDNLTIQQQPYQRGDVVTVGNGGGLHIANTGSASITTPNSNLHLQNILHCPSALANLLSIQKFCQDNNCYFILTTSYFVVKDMLTREILLHGPSEAGLYPVYLKQFSTNKRRRLVAFLGVTAPLSIWHYRLGHPSQSTLHKIIGHSTLSVSGSLHQEHLCEPCQLAKSKKLPFSSSRRVSKAPLEIVHSDVWTSPVVSISGCRYYVLFVDDFSRFTWIFPLKQKSDVFVCLIKFKCLVENFLSTKIKHFQSDGGGEYLSSQFKFFLSNMV